MPQRAWEIERQMRLNAVPTDRRLHASRWKEHITSSSDQSIPVERFWMSRVPGSGAPSSLYVGMVQSLANKGFDVSAAEELLPTGLDLAAQKNFPELRILTAELMERANQAPQDLKNPYHQFQHPADWPGIIQAMHTEAATGNLASKIPELYDRIYQGWLGQLAGGAFGTALEGYHGDQLRQVYGVINDYVTEPETMNDDAVYELVFLDALEKKGRELTSRDIASEWLRQIPYGYSAEWVALQNIRNGLFPPASATIQNPYSDWIGAQMRGMVCGMLAPAHPMEAARLAFLDGSVSHIANGLYGEIYAAVLTSLSFASSNLKEIIRMAANYLPQNSQYFHVLSEIGAILQQELDPSRAWSRLDLYFREYNWIHAYPNLAADLLALWYGEGDLTKSFSLLAQAGLDVDCNAGLVGNVLGVIHGVPEKWAAPLGDKLETYLPGKETLSIKALAERTFKCASA